MGTLGMDVKIETSELPPNFKYEKSTKYIEDLTEDDKGQWVELSDGELKNQMSGLMDYMYKEIDNVDWDAPKTKIFGADYYEETFPGFSPSTYLI